MVESADLITDVSDEKPKGKKARTRALLVNAATQLFLGNGYESTTVDEIAERAGVTRRTFFRHFPTKDSVVFPNHKIRIRMLQSLLRKHRSSCPPFKAVRKALLEFAGVYSRNAGELLTQYKIVQTSPALIARELEFDSEYLEALAESMMPDQASNALIRRQARILAGAVFGAVRSVLREWFASECTLDLMQLGESTLIMLEFGVGSLSFSEEILAKNK